MSKRNFKYKKGAGVKKTFDELLIELEQAISKKINTINEQSCDKEILAVISVYRYGSKEYSEYAKEWLSKFLVNANFINKIRNII